MRIRFIKPDPRAGSEAQMDSRRGQQLIDAGAAEQVRDDIAAPGLVTSVAAASRAHLDAALGELPGENTDPEYVVRQMRSFFRDAFTEADEEVVRAKVIAPPVIVPPESAAPAPLPAAEAPAPAPAAARRTAKSTNQKS